MAFLLFFSSDSFFDFIDMLLTRPLGEETLLEFNATHASLSQDLLISIGKMDDSGYPATFGASTLNI